MNSYYISPKKTFQDNIHCFHPILGAHYMDLQNNEILISAHFLSHDGQDQWEFLKDVIILPHPVLAGTKQLDTPHVNKLGKLGIIQGHTILDVAAKAGNLNSLMKFRLF